LWTGFLFVFSTGPSGIDSSPGMTRESSWTRNPGTASRQRRSPNTSQNGQLLEMFYLISETFFVKVMTPRTQCCETGTIGNVFFCHSGTGTVIKWNHKLTQ